MSVNSGNKPYWNFWSMMLAGDAAHAMSVNTGNGNLLVSVVDHVFQARIPAIISRFYNSSDAGTAGLAGDGWRFGFEESITTNTSSDNTYTDSSGTEYLFTWDTDHWDHPEGFFVSLTYGYDKFTIDR